MKARGASILLLLFGAVAAGTALLLPNPSVATTVGAADATPAPSTLGFRTTSAGGSLALSSSPNARDADRVPIAELSPDSAAALAEQVTLRQLAHDTDLQLSDTAWADLAAIVAHHQAIRHAHEAAIASVDRLADGRAEVHVPAYGDFGDLLRGRMFDEIARRLGADAADQVDLHLGGALEGHFAGFGVSAQTLEFPGPSLPGDKYITRTIAYSAPGDNDRLRTRREVHLPSIEDPSGTRWAPFMELLAKPRRS